MSDLIITRVFRAGIDHVYDYISKPEHVMQWWGPEGMTLPKAQLSLGEKGPWMSVMKAPDGSEFHVSGEVTDVDPPRSIGFTWAWHDEAGVRGHESRVRIELETVGEATRFTMTHSGLSDAESVASHERGWTSTMAKLEKLLPLETAA